MGCARASKRVGCVALVKGMGKGLEHFLRNGRALQIGGYNVL